MHCFVTIINIKIKQVNIEYFNRPMSQIKKCNCLYLHNKYDNLLECCTLHSVYQG